MIDQNSQFKAILTDIGAAKQANADALGIPWTFEQMGVGDANNTDPLPDAKQTRLINEKRRAPLNQLKPDPENPGVIVAEQVIPADVGGFWIREIGLYDLDGDLVAVANCAPTFKPLLAQGSGRTQIIRMVLSVSSLANIVLKIDPSVVLANLEYVDQSINKVLPGDKTPGTFHRVETNQYGVVIAGSNPTTLEAFGITDGATKQELENAVKGLAATDYVDQSIDKVKVKVDELVDGSTPAGKAKQLETARKLSVSGAATGEVMFDGTANANIALTLADNGVVAGSYAKVVINAKGLVVGSERLHHSDIPVLSWSAHIGDKPTSLEGYGISNGLFVDRVSQQRPTLAATTPGLEWNTGALEIRECGLVGGGQTGYDYAPKISFHWGGVYGGALGMASNGDLCWQGQKLWTQANFEPATVVPAGAVIAFAFGHTPDGYLRANGAAVSRTAYPRLFAVIGGHYGAGDGHSTFNLPDTRGLFVRGLDEGRGFDAGRGLGSFQDSQNLWHDHLAETDEAPDHTHGMYPIAANISTSLGAGHFSVGNHPSQQTPPAGRHRHAVTVHASGGHESRPVNIAFVYCIKY